jgi:hypothetical protein
LIAAANFNIYREGYYGYRLHDDAVRAVAEGIAD